ncbi:MAG: hypothetical protein BAJATHORv1_40221 [Candidatus Thorarchaeota archaeon]|nr:MAG: hypothetical protein BAJATHORv1_40221 [Candidatus Thorarchaeota archaeon]
MDKIVRDSGETDFILYSKLTKVYNQKKKMEDRGFTPINSLFMT